MKTANKSERVSMVPVPEITRLNAARVYWGMDPLPTSEMLDETLKAAGITHCEGKKYPWAP